MKNQLDLKKVKKASLVLRAINHKLRQDIMKVIDEEGSSIVTNIYTKLGIEQSIASQHLHVLRMANIVIANREGKFIYYSINKERIKEIETFVDQLLK
jgi:DNA-binding transcriptional ArsR family regulator